VTCFSGTYNRAMAFGTCLQSRFDDLWYQCTSIGWVQSGNNIASSRRGYGRRVHAATSRV
jgi:hypothetical protein